eukprot:TCALIF_05298-PA protein Name:"Protein of unknown function" AED:0.27 eAED:0.55 QI:0/0/0/1/1/1/2/0/116
MELKNSEVERNNIAPLEDPHEISKRLLEEHRRTMEEWFQAQLDHLVERQPCASDAVALEWLMKRSSVTKTTKGGSGCINWGEGLPNKVDKSAIKEAKKNHKTITKKSEELSEEGYT